MIKKWVKGYTIGCYLTILLTMYTDDSCASGFQLFTESVANLSTVGAGYAAEINDASTGYTNPAGLVMIQSPQLAIGLNSVKLAADYTGTNTWFIARDSIPLQPYIQNNKSITGSDSNLIPAVHYAIPINTQMVFGFSVNAPFGLSVIFPQTGFQRYVATKTALQVINMSPNLGFKATDKLALGIGLDVQRLSSEMNLVVGAPSPTLPGSPSKYDSSSENRLYSWGYGWHAGLLYQFNESTRIGLSYHSQIVHHPHGTSTISGPLADYWAGYHGLRSTNDLQTAITLPPRTTLSIYHTLNQQWALMATVMYTQWSTIEDLTLNNVAAVDHYLNPMANLAVPLKQDFRNTWSYMFGTSYRINSSWTLKAGIGYEQTPTNDAYRSLLIPDCNRWLAGIGAHYQATKAVGLDAGWMHVFMKNVNINSLQIAGPIGTTSKGLLSGQGDAIGVQVTMKFS